MTKISLVSLTLAAAAGTALAQAPAQPAKQPAQPPAAKPATPATPAAKPATPADASKKLPPPQAGAPVAPPPTTVMPPKPPTPPQELLDLAKAMNGTWKCNGKMMVAGTQMDMKATIAHKLDANLGKFWILSTLTGTMAKMPPMKVMFHTTFDGASKKLWRVSVNSNGGHGVSGASYDATKMVFDGDSVGMHGSTKFRHTEELVSPKEVKVTGEISKDGGKTYAADYETTCKK